MKRKPIRSERANRIRVYGVKLKAQAAQRGRLANEASRLVEAIFPSVEWPKAGVSN